MSLLEKLERKNRIIEQIKELQDIIAGVPNKEITSKITYAKKDREKLLSKFKDIQFKSRNENDTTILNNLHSELIIICDKLSDNQVILKELNQDLITYNKLNDSKDTEYKERLVTLFNELRIIEESIEKERELEEEENRKKEREKKYKGIDEKYTEYEKIVIDENFGIYINYPKNAVLLETIACIFGSSLNSLPKDSSDNILKTISNVSLPGLPSLLSVFIDTIIQTVSQGYVKHFFLFKNTIDLLVGMELGEILGTMIPGLTKVIKELKLLFTDAPRWIFSKIMGPLFDINIPIPSFNLDLSALIPALPFMIKVPKIDPFGYFDKATPFNINIDPSDIPLNWQEEIMKGVEVGDFEENFKKLQSEKIQKIQNQIEKIKSELNTALNKDELLLKLKELENDLIELIDIEKPKISNLQIAKRTLLLSYQQNIPQLGLNDRFSKLWDYGINIFDNQVTEFLQKCGYDFTNDKMIYKLKMLRDKYGIDFKNAAHLYRLYQIGFNFNDPKHIDKLNILLQYNIDIKNKILMELLMEIGFNLNNDNIYNIIKVLNDELSINISDIEILKKLNTIGFNFNNINMIERLKILSKYVDIRTSTGYENALARNVNLNNPFLNDLLKKYTQINLNWNDDNFLKTEAEILSTITVEQINRVVDILHFFDKINTDLNLFFDKTSLSNNEFIKYVYTFNIDETLSLMNNNSVGLNIPKTFEYKEEIIPGKLQWYEEMIIKKQIPGSYTTLIDYGTYEVAQIEPDKPLKIKLFHDNGFIFKVLSNTETISSITYTWIDSDGDGIDDIEISGLTWTTNTTTSYDKLYCISIISEQILEIVNRWQKYGILLKNSNGEQIPQLTLPFVGAQKFSNINVSVENVFMIKDDKEIFIKLELLKDFVTNKGWVINGIRIGDNLGTLDAQTIIDANNYYGTKLQLTDNTNTKEGEITYEQLSGLYGNFDKIGLNIRDTNFFQKVYDLSNKLKIRADEATILETKRKVTLTYYDKDSDGNYNVERVIDLSNNKPDPKVFDDERYKARIEITNVIDPNIKKIPTKTIIQFDSINKMGFNFQNPQYNILLDKLQGLKFNIGAFQTVDIVDSLCSLGWHYYAKDSIQKINKLIELGFDFSIPNTTSTDGVDMDDKLNVLNNMGFNFCNSEWLFMLQELKSIGLNMQNKDFERSIEELISFGINFNDIDWKNKISKIKELGIDFSTIENGIKKWVNQLDNLNLLGVNFQDNEWLNNFNKANKLKTFGIDYLNTENRQKLAILTKIGVDFTKSEDDYMQKIEALVQLQLIDIPEEIKNKKIEYLKEREKNLSKILNRLNYLDDVLNGKIMLDIDINIKKLKAKQKLLYNEINILKSGSINNLNEEQLNKISSNLNLKCFDFEKINNNINELLEKRKIISKLNILDIQIERDLLFQKKIELDLNKIYKLNNDLIFMSLDKFQMLDELGINFYDKNWMKIINDVLSAPFNFGMTDWKNKINDIKNLIPKNAILDWTKKITDSITSVITMPLKMVFELIKKLISLITKIISIPLNPAKIPDWIIGNPNSLIEEDWGILTRFMKMIELIKTLPTLDGMMDFLFLKESGLMLVDLFVKGFAKFMTKIKEMVVNFESQVKISQEQMKQLKTKLKNMIENKSKKINDLLNKKSLIESLLLGDENNTLIKIIKKLKLQELIYLKNIDLIKKSIKDNTPENILKTFETELENNCKKVTELKQQIIKYTNELNILKNKSKLELKNMQNSLQLEIDKLNEIYNTDSLTEEIKKNKEKIEELQEQISVLSNFYKFKNNQDKLIEILKKIKLTHKDNPYDKPLEIINNKIKVFKNKILTIQKNLENIPTNNEKLNKLQLLFNNNNLEMEKLKKYLCDNKNVISDDEFFKKMNELAELQKNLLDLKNQIEKFKLNIDIEQLTNTKLEYENELKKLENQKKLLLQKFNEFVKNINIETLEFDNIIKWLPVIINIISCAPKFVVNIFVALFNAVGSMKNLPALWDFPYV